MGIWDLIISKAVNKETLIGIASTGGGLIAQTAISASVGAFKLKNLTLQLGQLGEEDAEKINVNFESIFESMISTLNQLDKDMDFRLALGDLIQSEINACCRLEVHPNTKLYSVPKLHRDLQKKHEDDLIGTAGVEKTIDEFFDSYLIINRKESNTRNRVAAIACIQIMRNATMILMALMKEVARLPGKDNEKRLERFKLIMTHFFENVLNNGVLSKNLNKNLMDYFSSNEKQREILLRSVNLHTPVFIDVLHNAQQSLSMHQLSEQSACYFFTLNSSFLEIVVRLLDKEAAQEHSELTPYKLQRGVLRADTSEKIGEKRFNEKGVIGLLKPLAGLMERVNTAPHTEDVVSVIRHHDFFKDINAFEQPLKLWDSKQGFKALSFEEKRKIAKDFAAIIKLLLLCQAFEKEFAHSITQYGLLEMQRSGLYDIKRQFIQQLHAGALTRMKQFCGKATAISDLIQQMGNNDFLKKHHIQPSNESDTAFVKKCIIPGKTDIIQQESIISNSEFQYCVNTLNLTQEKLSYSKQFFLTKQSEGKNSVIPSKRPTPGVSVCMDEYHLNRIYIMDEFDFFDSINPEDTSPTGRFYTDLLQQRNNIHTLIELITVFQKAFSVRASRGMSSESNYYLYWKESVATGYKTINNCGQIIELFKAFQSIFSSQQYNPIRVDENGESYRSTNSEVMVLKRQFDVNTFTPATYLAVSDFFERLQRLIWPKENHVEALNNEMYLHINAINVLMHEMVKNNPLYQDQVRQIITSKVHCQLENSSLQQTLHIAHKNIERLRDELDNSQVSVLNLKDITEKNQQIIKEFEKNNEIMLQSLLEEFEQNILKIKELNGAFDEKLSSIQKQLLLESSESVKQLTGDIELLKQDMKHRLEDILQRFKKYEAAFEKSNSHTKETFDSLKKSISAEQILIERLEKQLSSALEQVKKEKQKTAQFFAPQDKPKLVVYNLPMLFKQMDKKFSKHLRFFHSYRPVKTDSLLYGLELLLTNKSILENSINDLSVEQLSREVKTWLAANKTVHAYHGFSNKSVSQAVLTEIVVGLKAGTLIQTLKKTGIEYHGQRITLNEAGQLAYAQQARTGKLGIV